MTLKIVSFSNEYEFLSNFSPHETRYQGITYRTSEHAYQAAKSLDRKDRAWVWCAPSPGEAKRRGQEITKRESWNTIKAGIMYDVLVCKYKDNPELQEELLATGDREIIEGNTWHDNYLGGCICARCVQGSIPSWNTLGELHMRIRKELQDDGTLGVL